MSSSQQLLVIICSILLVLLLASHFIFKGKEKYSKVIDVIFKVTAITLFTFYIIRNTLSDRFIWVINGGKYDTAYYKAHDYLQSFLRWGWLVSVCLIPTAAFYKNKTLYRFTFIISLVNVVLTIIYYENYLSYFLSALRDPTTARGIITKPWFRYFEFDVEIITVAIATMIIGVRENKNLLFRKWKDVFNFFFYLPFLFVVAIPVCVPQSLFGFTNLYMKLFTVQHFVWLAGTVAIVFVIYLCFRKADIIVRKIVVLYICLFVFQHYNSIYLMNLNASRLPFQLCNVGSYFMLVAFIFQNKPWGQKFFDFIFIINVFGTIFATIGFDLKEGLLSYWNVHYYLEHIWIFAIPYLMVGFKIYQVPNKHCYLHAWVGFNIYFVVCLTCGIIFNAYCYQEGHRFWNKVNYFYLFDSTVPDILTFLKGTYKYTIYINGYGFNPFIPIAVYAMFLPGSFLAFLVSKKICAIARDHTQLHERKIAMKKAAKEAQESC